MKIKALAVPMLVSLSLVLGACGNDQSIESPDGIDGAAQDGVEGVEQGVEDAGNAIEDAGDDVEDASE